MQNITDKILKHVPDISWPKDFLELKLIDDALRCGICYDYIKTCMVTPCAHSYCSICIRRSLQYKTACPTCFEETFETSLRNNRVLDRVTELFSSIKEKLVKHLKIAAIHFSSNEQISSPVASQNITSVKSNASDTTPKRILQKPSKSSSSKGKLKFIPSAATEANLGGQSYSTNKSDISKRLEDILGSSVVRDNSDSEMDCLIVSSENDSSRIGLPVPTVPPMFLQPKIEVQSKTVDAPTVPCPVCNVNIPERNINAHLDNCLANVDKPPIKSPVMIKQKRRNPLPKMVWSLMGEKDLRKKLKDYGLNTQGDKKVLISRIQRYILLFNSECDSDNPRPISEIIRQVEREEKQNPAQSHQRMFLNSKSDPKIIEEENKKYVQENKESFKNLIEAMKRREGRNIRPLSLSSCRILSDDEDNDINNHLAAENGKGVASTSTCIGDSIDLCDSNGSDENNFERSSPILGASAFANKELCNGHASDTALNMNSVRDENDPKLNTTHISDLDQLCSMLNSPEAELINENSRNSSRPSSPFKPSQTPSPSCIVATHFSDSEDSFSLLTNTNPGEEDGLGEPTESFTDCVPNVNSQLDDPDFVLDTEVENNSDEVFIPQRRSKRKHQQSVLSDSKQQLSPRRTKRRFNK